MIGYCCCGVANGGPMVIPVVHIIVQKRGEYFPWSSIQLEKALHRAVRSPSLIHRLCYSFALLPLQRFCHVKCAAQRCEGMTLERMWASVLQGIVIMSLRRRRNLPSSFFFHSLDISDYVSDSPSLRCVCACVGMCVRVSEWVGE